MTISAPTNHEPKEAGEVTSSVKREPQDVDEQGALLPPVPHSKIDLRDAHAIRRALADVFRDMRSGRIATQDGTRLAYVLDMIRKAHETAVLQDRIELLERTIEQRKK